MAITDYKVTATPLTVGVGSAGDLLTGSSPAELAANKAIFDAFPDAIKEKHDDLIDYIDNFRGRLSVTAAAAATANKGSFEGWIPLNGIIEILFTNGNTAAAPTITIDTTEYTLSGTPTVAKISTSDYQIYRYRKTGASTLTFIDYPDYVCEYGVTALGTVYERRSSGRSSGFRTRDSEVQVYSATGSLYASPDLSITFPTGLFNEAPDMTGSSVKTQNTFAWIVDKTPTQTQGVYAIVKTTAGNVSYYHTVKYEGTWR